MTLETASLYNLGGIWSQQLATSFCWLMSDSEKTDELTLTASFQCSNLQTSRSGNRPMLWVKRITVSQQVLSCFWSISHTVTTAHEVPTADLFTKCWHCVMELLWVMYFSFPWDFAFLPWPMYLLPSISGTISLSFRSPDTCHPVSSHSAVWIPPFLQHKGKRPEGNGHCLPSNPISLSLPVQSVVGFFIFSPNRNKIPLEPEKKEKKRRIILTFLFTVCYSHKDSGFTCIT